MCYYLSVSLWKYTLLMGWQLWLELMQTFLRRDSWTCIFKMSWAHTSEGEYWDAHRAGASQKFPTAFSSFITSTTCQKLICFPSTLMNIFSCMFVKRVFFVIFKKSFLLFVLIESGLREWGSMLLLFLSYRHNVGNLCHSNSKCLDGFHCHLCLVAHIHIHI